jgi:hypothetical protein
MSSPSNEGMQFWMSLEVCKGVKHEHRKMLAYNLISLLAADPTVGKSAPKPERKESLEKFKAQYGL